jgi:hypothetical protein
MTPNLLSLTFPMFLIEAIFFFWSSHNAIPAGLFPPQFALLASFPPFMTASDLAFTNWKSRNKNANAPEFYAVLVFSK